MPVNESYMVVCGVLGICLPANLTLLYVQVALWGYSVEPAQTSRLRAEHYVITLGTFCMTAPR